MKKAILFWFYKNLDVCKNRLKIIRHFNPKVKIYCLYGGEKKQAGKYKEGLKDYLDDFYCSPFKDSDWKWVNGDLMIADWYSKRGERLQWDTIIVIQWDMLVLGNIDRIFPLKKDKLLLSGLRKIKDIEWKWTWISKPKHRKHYLEFLEYVRKKYNFKKEPLSCIFVVVCLPRVFLKKYAHVKHPELGFIEYRVPIYAQIFKIDLIKDKFFMPDAWDPKIQKIINALDKKISLTTIKKHLKNPKGKRVFHPYYKKFDIKLLDKIK